MSTGRRFGEFFAELQTDVIAYHPRLVRVTGGVTSTILLGQLLYWTPRTRPEAEGWIYKTQPELELETGLTRREQDTARKKLRDSGILQEKKVGVPAKLFFRIDLEALSNLYEQTYPEPDPEESPVWRIPPNKDGAFRQTRLRESAKQVSANQPNKVARKRQPLLGTESTDRDYLQPPLPPQKSAGVSGETSANAEEDRSEPTPKTAAKDQASDFGSASEVVRRPQGGDKTPSGRRRGGRRRRNPAGAFRDDRAGSRGVFTSKRRRDGPGAAGRRRVPGGHSQPGPPGAPGGPPRAADRRRTQAWTARRGSRPLLRAPGPDAADMAAEPVPRGHLGGCVDGAVSPPPGPSPAEGPDRPLAATSCCDRFNRHLPLPAALIPVLILQGHRQPEVRRSPPRQGRGPR